MAGRMRILVGGRALVAEVADSYIEKRQGLQGHAPLRDDEGMFFPYARTQEAQFIMGTVSFPIDIVFLERVGSNEYAVVKAYRNIQPGDRGIFRCNRVDAVLETRGGLCDSIQLHDRVRTEHDGTGLHVRRARIRRVAGFGTSDIVEDATAPGGVDMPAPGKGRRTKHLDMAVGRPVNDSDVRGGPLNLAIARLVRAQLDDENWQQIARKLLGALDRSPTWESLGEALAEQASRRKAEHGGAQARGLYGVRVQVDDPFLAALDSFMQQAASERLFADAQVRDRLGRVLRNHIDGTAVRVKLPDGPATLQAQFEGIDRLEPGAVIAAIRVG